MNLGRWTPSADQPRPDWAVLSKAHVWRDVHKHAIRTMVGRGPLQATISDINEGIATWAVDRGVLPLSTAYVATPGGTEDIPLSKALEHWEADAAIARITSRQIPFQLRELVEKGLPCFLWAQRTTDLAPVRDELEGPGSGGGGGL